MRLIPTYREHFAGCEQRKPTNPVILSLFCEESDDSILDNTSSINMLIIQ